MKILPILFYNDMVKAILNGKKTCTRRIVKPTQFVGNVEMIPNKCRTNMPNEYIKNKPFMLKPYCDMTDSELIMTAYKKPYQPGDILYVRETWSEIKYITRLIWFPGHIIYHPVYYMSGKHGVR